MTSIFSMESQELDSILSVSAVMWWNGLYRNVARVRLKS